MADAVVDGDVVAVVVVVVVDAAVGYNYYQQKEKKRTIWDDGRHCVDCAWMLHRKQLQHRRWLWLQHHRLSGI